MTATMPMSQVPGAYRMRVGDAVVTAISDGALPSNPAMLQNIAPAEVEATLAAFARVPPLFTAVNVFVVQTPAQTILIDTGGGALYPGLGQMMANLAAAGIAADDIDAVLMTHLHGDHVGGLLTPDGQPAFANAALLVPEAEAAYWLDDTQAATAPEGRKATFAAARHVTAPYGSRLRIFTEASPLPGIEAVPLPGHTPGHTGYMLSAGTDRLLIWGDIVHAPEIQCRHPATTVIFDIDPAMAVATRQAILARAADERLLVAGMHAHFPGFVRIVREGDGYAPRPIAWQATL